MKGGVYGTILPLRQRYQPPARDLEWSTPYDSLAENGARARRSLNRGAGRPKRGRLNLNAPVREARARGRRRVEAGPRLRPISRAIGQGRAQRRDVPGRADQEGAHGL
jgi:hypothetical protein